MHNSHPVKQAKKQLEMAQLSASGKGLIINKTQSFQGIGSLPADASFKQERKKSGSGTTKASGPKPNIFFAEANSAGGSGFGSGQD